jgi:hypothetical protein
MATEWIGPLFSLFGEAAEWIASLPEKDRQRAIDAMKFAHSRAVEELANFRRDTQADLDEAKAVLDALSHSE